MDKPDKAMSKGSRKSALERKANSAPAVSPQKPDIESANNVQPRVPIGGHLSPLWNK